MYGQIGNLVSQSYSLIKTDLSADSGNFTQFSLCVAVLVKTTFKI